MVNGANDADVLIARLRDVDVQRTRPAAFGKIVVNRFQYAKEQQSDADACREHHRDPARIGVVGFSIFTTDPDRADRQDDQDQAEQQNGINGQNQKPVKGAGQPRSEPAKKRSRGLLVRQRNQDKRDNQKTGNQEYRVVDVQSKWSDIILTQNIIRIELVFFGQIRWRVFHIRHDAPPFTVVMLTTLRKRKRQG